MKKKDYSHLLREIPAGSFIRTEKGYFFVFSQNKRYRIVSKTVLDSWAPQRVLELSEVHPSVQAMRISSKLKMRNGSLIYWHHEGRIFLISEGKRRVISNPALLTAWGESFADITWVTEEEVKLHPEGEEII